MSQIRKHRLLLLCGVLLLSCAWTAPIPAKADRTAQSPQSMPGVTEEMTDPTFWSGLTADPDALLATAEEITQINTAAIAAEGSNRRDMRSLKDTYDGVARNEALVKSSAEDAKYYLGWIWDQNGKKLEQDDFDRITANVIDPNATEEMPVHWGIAVNRTDLITFPWDGQLLDDPSDIDFDYQPLVGIRVNEPVAVYSTSADGEYFSVSTSCCTGWVRAEDIAICRDREEWLSAWDLPAEKRLVFWGDKMYTDYSNSAPSSSCRLITMGTVLERMEETDPDTLVINRLPLHNYAVYLPVRNEDGSYGKTPALINARECVSEDYLPLTSANLAKVALASLGDAYGWGAGLNNEDCTSLNHSIFCCFGLDLPRNGTWQQLVENMPRIMIGNYTLEEKEALLDALPLGSLLNFPGHQMMYLGKQAGEYYVISTVSSLMSPTSGKRQRTRCCQINTLDIKRANGKTWMAELNRIFIPWVCLAEGEAYPQPELPVYHAYTAFVLEKGLMDPYPTGYFLPDHASTRAEAVEMLWRIAGKPEPDMSAEGFPDAAAGSEHERAALWAKQAGIYSGEDVQFRGNTALTGNFLDELCRRFLDDAPDGLVPKTDTVLTRAELAQAAQAVWTAYEAQKMPEAPFGTASASSPYYAKPCNERLASLPEALMKMAEGGYSWEYEYVSGKPAYALTLVDYSNIYSFIHTHDLDEAALREVLSDASQMVHRKAFTEEEIDLLLGDDSAAAMAHFASPSTIVVGEKGYSEKWLYDHPLWAWRTEGITPEMVTAVQDHYYNPLFTQEAADAFSRKLYLYTGVVTPVKWNQWKFGDVKPDGTVEEEKDTENGVMLDVIEFCQYPDYPTGCESVSLYMLLNYYGVDVTVDDIYDLLPMGAQPYDDENGVRHGANPEREFVGDPRSEYSYGVFNEPIAQVAEQFRPGMVTKTGATVDDIKAILDAGNPVLAWYVSAPMRDIMYRWCWLDEEGETVYWPGGEHAVVVCGYDETSLTYRDPNAGTTVTIDYSTFEKSFTELGGRIVYDPNPAYDEVFVIVHTNDVHGFIDVEPYVKTVADGMKARYGEKNVLTVSAGDVFSGGNAVAHLYNGETIPPIMEAAGYDILTPGNNDLILGGDQLLALAGMFDHTKFLCVNLFRQVLDENGVPAVDENGNLVPGDTVFDRTMTVETSGGTKIGLFGLTISFAQGGDGFVSMGTIDGAREAVDILKADGCGVIIGVGHTGWNDDLITPSANDVTSAQMVKEVPGIDAYVDGHSHSIINGGSGWICPETGTLVNQASCKGACVGVIKLYIKDGTVVRKHAELLTDEVLEAHDTPDPAVQALADAAWERLAGDAGEMILESPYFLNAYRVSESADKRSIRADETNLGDLVADFMRSYTDADVALAPGVMIRCSIEKGKIYTLNLYDVFAIGCDLYVTEMTGEELLSRMAASLTDLPYESPIFTQISGASYGYLKEYTFSEKGEKIYTIINPMVNGEPLQPEKVYRVAYSFAPNKSGDPEPVLSTMEEAAAAMSEYLKSGEAVILPDVPVPDHRIVPMEEIPADAILYEVKLKTANDEAA